MPFLTLIGGLVVSALVVVGLITFLNYLEKKERD
jgi:hypothetical protein